MSKYTINVDGEEKIKIQSNLECKYKIDKICYNDLSMYYGLYCKKGCKDFVKEDGVIK